MDMSSIRIQAEEVRLSPAQIAASVNHLSFGRSVGATGIAPGRLLERLDGRDPGGLESSGPARIVLSADQFQVSP